MSKTIKLKKRKRAKNICKCGKKMELMYNHCDCGHCCEYYACSDWENCGKEYDIEGNEL